jgi:hypothetical protein
VKLLNYDKILKKLKEFFINIFLFIDKYNIEINITWNLIQNEYLTLTIGI